MNEWKRVEQEMPQETAHTSGWIKEGTWTDVMDDARTIRDQGSVQIQNRMRDPDSGQVHTIAQVESQTNPGEFYETEIWQDDPNSPAITLWSCDCPWGQKSWGRTRQWKKYEGRPCKHTLALYWQSLGTPIQDGDVQTPQQPQQPQMGEGPQDWVQAPSTPGGANFPVQPLDQPAEIQSDIEQQPAAVEQPFSQPQGPPTQDSNSIHFPGALSKRADVLFPPCPNCGEVAGFEPYPWARGFMWCKHCQHLITPEALGDLFNKMMLHHDLDLATLPETEHPLGDQYGGWKRADHNGWTNWDTWHTALLIDNTQPIQQAVHSGIGTGWTVEQFRDWVLRNVVGPHNADQLKDTQEWNALSPDERREMYPDALIDHDEDDTPSMLMNEGDINWQEIYDHIRDEIMEEQQYMDNSQSDLTVPQDWTSSWRREGSFTNGDIVRCKVPVSGTDRDGSEYTIPRNASGEVIWSDDKSTIVIFPLKNNGPLQSHLVRVEDATDNFYLSPSFNPGPRRR
jgi:hypothetical protein